MNIHEKIKAIISSTQLLRGIQIRDENGTVYNAEDILLEAGLIITDLDQWTKLTTPTREWERQLGRLVDIVGKAIENQEKRK
jgi:hypothetical protein